MNIGSEFLNGTTNFQNIDTVGKLVTLFLNAVFVLAGLILLFFFIMGGIGMISGAGANDPQKVEQSKKTLTSAVIGFVVVFVSFWIVQLIGSLLNITGII